MTPLLSIIIPAYNAEKTLARTLRSLRVVPADRRDALEVLVIDDGSTDRTTSVADAELSALAPANARLIRKDNGGSATARNAGLDAATGSWLMFLDSDDELIADPLAAIELAPEFTAITVGGEAVRRSKVIERRDAVRLNSRNAARKLTAANPLWNSSVIFRREAIHEQFPTEVRSGEDWHFWLANAHLFNHAHIARGIRLVRIHVHGANKSRLQHQRGVGRQWIAEQMLDRPLFRDHPVARHNLMLQRQIGIIQQGGKVDLCRHVRLPASTALLIKLIVYATLHSKFHWIDPYAQA